VVIFILSASIIMKYRLVCFDLDGTLVDDIRSIWSAIHTELGTDTDERKKAMKDFFAGRITYDEWAKHDIMLWKQAGLTKERLAEIVSQMKLMSGAKEAVFELKRRGYVLAVISGSIQTVIDVLFPDHPFDYVFINKILFDKTGLVSGVESTQYDTEHKATALRLICKKESIKAEEAVFIGDHDNDVEAARAAGLSIAFNPVSQELKEACDIVITKKDVREILEHL